MWLINNFCEKEWPLLFLLTLLVGCGSDVTGKTTGTNSDTGMLEDMDDLGTRADSDSDTDTVLCDTIHEWCECGTVADCTIEILGSKLQCAPIGGGGSECRSCETYLDCPFGFRCSDSCQGPMPCNHNDCQVGAEGFRCDEGLDTCGHDKQHIPDDLSLYPNRVDMGSQDMSGG